MEVLSKSSPIRTAPGTSAIDIAVSSLSFQDSYYRHIESNVPSDDKTKNLNFSILPSMTSEWYPSESVIITEWKVTKADGTALTKKDQVGKKRERETEREGLTDEPTDRRMDIASHRDARHQGPNLL